MAGTSGRGGVVGGGEVVSLVMSDGDRCVVISSRILLLSVEGMHVVRTALVGIVLVFGHVFLLLVAIHTIGKIIYQAEGLLSFVTHQTNGALVDHFVQDHEKLKNSSPFRP